MQSERRGLLVEGWRGINHSFALTNQHQLLAMRGMPGIELFHRDLPFAMAHWNAKDHDAGFPAADRTWLLSLREPRVGLDRVDGVYRISSPFRAGAGSAWAGKRTLTFMVTEVGLSPLNLAADGVERGYWTQGDNAIVTPSAWTRDRIVAFGFPAERVHVVPHGVDTQTFTPLDAAVRPAVRAAIGIAEDETVFINVGAPLWDKGIDTLLRAFAVLRLRGHRVRLLCKDQSGLYGLAVADTIRTLGATCPALVDERVVSGITTVPLNLTPEQLARLLACADAYVSPYRAEGFNLPVLEAIACGVPTIVTAGGATDDFCDDRLSMRIPGRFSPKDDGKGLVGAFIEPDVDALIAAMTAIACGWRPDRTAAAAARKDVLARCHWTRAAEQIVRLALEGAAAVKVAA
ncbi:MAG TPA: glycosyltransferase family 4 protein [Acidisphaera sp.]|nr:glycosyltransferase family 4 protein [Acidisphaera sp.]